MARVDIKDWARWQKAAKVSGYQATKVAVDLGISRRQLYRYTIAAFGCSPQQWLRDLRALAAAPLLREYRSVKQVASELGFKQISHFTRDFKGFYGVPPTAYLTWIDTHKEVAGPLCRLPDEMVGSPISRLMARNDNKWPTEINQNTFINYKELHP